MLESLPILEALGGAAKSLLTGILSTKLRARLSDLSQKKLDELFEKAAKKCTIELKPEKRKALRDAFRQSKVGDKVLALQEYRVLIPDAFFVEIFAPIVGQQHAKDLANDLFTQLRKLIAKEQALQNEISALHSEIIIDLLQKQMGKLQQQGENVESIKATVERLEALLEKRADVATSIGSTEIAPLPDDYVSPATTLERVKSAGKNVILLYGPPGAGKSVTVATCARAAQEQDQPVFWYRFRRSLDDHNSVQKKLTAFVQAELRSDEASLSQLLQHSGALLVFDDLHYVKDENLQQLLHTVAAIVAESANCRLLLTSRKKSGFLPPNLKAIDITGLSAAETEQLLCEIWQMALSPKQLANAKTLFQGNPQFLVYFHEWQREKQPDEAQIDAYFEKAFETDAELHDYLMDELYQAMGGADGDQNKLLKAAAFCRVPESKDLIERLYAHFAGRNFSDTLYELHNRRRLLSRLPDSDRYDLHDLLRQFYYDRTQKRAAVHRFAAGLYRERSQQSNEIIDFIESGHHFMKAGEHEAAAQQMQPVTHYCTARGLFWQVIADVLDKIKMDAITDPDLKAGALYDRGNLKFKMGQWNDAFADLSACLVTKPGSTAALNSIGLVYQAKGEWDQAIEFYNKSLQGLEQVGDMHGMAQTFGNLGVVYRAKGEWDQAIEFYNKDLKISEQVGDMHGMAQTFGNLGVVYQAKGEWDQAIEFYNKSLQGKEQVGDMHGMAQTFGNLSLLAFEKKDYDPAIRLHLEILLLFAKLGAAPQVSQAQGILGSFRKQMDTAEFDRINQAVLNKIFAEGVKWGKHQVVAPAEAQGLLPQQK